jgi:hypothetical protein
MLATPIFDSALLGDVFDAFQRRGKAIRYHGALEWSRDVEQGSERLNIDVAITDSVRLRLSIWPDGAFWLAVTKPGPSRTGGWQIHEQIEGTAAEIPPSEIVARFESTMSSPTDAVRIWHNPHI